MGVFPAASSKHVPEPWAELMSSPVSRFMYDNTHIAMNISLGFPNHRFLS